MRLGAKAGVNFSSISGDTSGDFSGLTSFHIGGLVEIPINEKFSIQPEILYSMQGAAGEYYVIPFGGFGTKYETNLKLDYINIPIMAKYYVIEGLSLEAGPQFGILVSAKEEGKLIEQGSGESETFDRDVKENYNSLDVAFGLGAAYRLNNGIFFSARYLIGISQILNNDNVDTRFYLSDFNQRNNVFQLSVGYSF